jgi:putative oxidoreductase
MMSIRIIVAQVVLGLLFFLIGCMMIAGMKPLVENFRHFGYPQWFRVMTGSLEALGGAGLLIGIWIPVLAALASAGLALVMLGAVFTHVRVREPLKKSTPAIVLGALASLVVISYWPMFIPLLTSR